MAKFTYAVNPAPGYGIGDYFLELPQYFGKKWNQKIFAKVFDKYPFKIISSGCSRFTFITNEENSDKADEKVHKFLDELVYSLTGSVDFKFKIEKGVGSNIMEIYNNRKFEGPPKFPLLERIKVALK